MPGTPDDSCEVSISSRVPYHITVVPPLEDFEQRALEDRGVLTARQVRRKEFKTHTGLFSEIVAINLEPDSRAHRRTQELAVEVVETLSLLRGAVELHSATASALDEDLRDRYRALNQLRGK